jgi:hypothetical protein
VSGFKMDDYVDVAERLRLFKAEYPDGSLSSTLEPLRDVDGNLNGWLCRAEAYRTADDQRPGVGHAVEPVPGKTPYTRDSEAMNAETSAWGRAIIALGFPTKKIASAEEVRNRQADERVEGPKALEPPKTWPKLEEMIGAYDQAFHDLFGEFVKACARFTFGPEIDIKKLAASDKKLLLQKAAGAALHIREQFDPTAFPPPGIEDIRVAFARVLDGVELAIPEEQHQLDAEALEAAERDA